LLLPGAKLHGYLANNAANIKDLTSTYPLVAVHAPLGETPELCEGCEIVGQRMEMRSRHSSEEIIAMLKGQLGKYLFATEYLVATPVNNAELLSVKDVCR
jgi:hypothetical protein